MGAEGHEGMILKCVSSHITMVGDRGLASQILKIRQLSMNTVIHEIFLSLGK